MRRFGGRKQVAAGLRWAAFALLWLGFAALYLGAVVWSSPALTTAALGVLVVAALAALAG